jgi:hypothetical protein
MLTQLRGGGLPLGYPVPCTLPLSLAGLRPEIMPWRAFAAIVNYRPDFWPEGAPHVNIPERVVADPRWVPDIKTDCPLTVGHNISFTFVIIMGPEQLWPVSDCTANYRPVHSSERAPSLKKELSVQLLNRAPVQLMTTTGLLDYWIVGFGIEFWLSSLWFNSCCSWGTETVR